MTEQSNNRRTEYREKISDFRKRTSEKVGRFVSGIMFDAKIAHMSRYTGVNFGEQELDVMREEHYQSQREKRERYKDKSINLSRRMGAYAMFMPGANHIASSISEFKHERSLQRKRRAGYKREHGTVISRVKNNLQMNKTRLNEVKDQNH